MNHSVKILFYIACYVLTLSPSSYDSYAGTISNPTGLNPGDQYRLAFITEGTRDATSTDIADYNAFVTAEANRAGSVVANLTTNWMAIGSTAAVHARDNTGTDPTPAGPNGIPIYLLDGSTRIADDYDDLWDSTLDATLSIDQFLSQRITTVWTGSNPDGQRVFLFSLGNNSSTAGNSSSQTNPWIRNAFVTNTRDFSMYGISGVLTVVPEPTSLASLLVGAAGVATLRRYRNN